MHIRDIYSNDKKFDIKKIEKNIIIKNNNKKNSLFFMKYHYLFYQKYYYLFYTFIVLVFLK